jgi:hypothetical protein
MASWRSYLDPRNWLGKKPVHDEYDISHLDVGSVFDDAFSGRGSDQLEAFTEREKSYLADESLFAQNIDEDALWSGQWIDCFSSWLVSYRFEAAPLPLQGDEIELRYVEDTHGPAYGQTVRMPTDTGSLYILFKSGAICRYDAMPPHMALGLHQALSKGRWVRANLYKIWPYTLAQEPHEGARQAMVSQEADRRFVRNLQEQQGLTEEEALEKNREVTARFRQELEVPNFVSDLLSPSNLPNLESVDSLLEELW